jgi:hypothetical protein
MSNEITIRACLSCRKAIKGRTDKKFCDDFCRNNYNNHLKSGDNNYMRNINNALRKNRRILATLLEGIAEGKLTISKGSLAAQGFAFNYFTHIYTNKEGRIYYLCYDYGYLPLQGDFYLLVKREEKHVPARINEKV